MRTISNLRPTFVATFAVLLATLSAGTAVGATPNFSGTWQFNAAKGENLGMMASIKQTIAITQDAKSLTLKEASDMQGQKSARAVRYDLGGASVKNDAAMGGASDTVARWDGAKLVVVWTSPGSVAGTVNTRTETRSLGADGRTMTVVTVRSGSNPKPVTMVYDRQ